MNVSNTMIPEDLEAGSAGQTGVVSAQGSVVSWVSRPEDVGNLYVLIRGTTDIEECTAYKTVHKCERVVLVLKCNIFAHNPEILEKSVSYCILHYF